MSRVGFEFNDTQRAALERCGLNLRQVRYLEEALPVLGDSLNRQSTGKRGRPKVASPEAVDVIYRAIFRAVWGATNSPRAPRDDVVVSRADTPRGFLAIARICFQAAGCAANPERSIREWIEHDPDPTFRLCLGESWTSSYEEAALIVERRRRDALRESE
ncbi:hypothetical protein FQY83_14225 [Luteimonas marina]|uniref:Uncharacterized protein n=1 Tax=Luteimonas marina TaxID=488485 RepID=A0A5C5TYY0_9GAMM|nr:hypothetical protein [Luteimonas marina]TWT18532.1 hypothetical protein FQY83_14225 [Luteimonas marina]